MKDLKGDLRNLGYDLEEAYFHKVNRELIERIKSRKSRKMKSEPRGKEGEIAPVIHLDDYRRKPPAQPEKPAAPRERRESGSPPARRKPA